MADILGACAPGAVHHADLSFSTAEAARRTPRVLEDLTVLAQATGVVAAAHGVDQACARQIIAEAAAAACLHEVTVAREFIQQYPRDGEAP